jgi:hypothetical protein
MNLIKMRTLLLLFPLIAFLLQGCGQSEEPSSNDNNSNFGKFEQVDGTAQDGLSAVPTTFTPKIIIEQLTGGWCGWCPFGTYYMERLSQTNPNQVYGIAVHMGDPLERRNIGDYLSNTYSLRGYPGGMINRNPSITDNSIFMHPLDWTANVGNYLATNEAVGAGLAFTSEIKGDKAIITTHIGIGDNLDTNRDYALILYVTEDGVTGAPQENYLSGREQYSNYPYYNMPSTIRDYVHNNTVRRTLTRIDGEPIPRDMVVKGKKIKISHEVEVGANPDKMFVVGALLVKRGATYRVLNAEKVKFGEKAEWN